MVTLISGCFTLFFREDLSRCTEFYFIGLSSEFYLCRTKLVRLLATYTIRLNPLKQSIDYMEAMRSESRLYQYDGDSENSFRRFNYAP
jgi:hypothetical protein